MMPRKSYLVSAALAAAVLVTCQWQVCLSSSELKDTDGGGLSVPALASRFAFPADTDTLASWQQGVMESVKKLHDSVKSDSLYSGARFTLKEAPEHVFRYGATVSPRIFDFISDDNSKRLVLAETLFADGQVIEDPLRDAKEMGRHVEGLVKVLRTLGSKLQFDVEGIFSLSDHITELLESGMVVQDMKELDVLEEVVWLQLDVAKGMVRDNRQVHADTLKKIAEAGYVLRDAESLIANMGDEAKNVRRGLSRIKDQFSRQVESIDVKMQTSVEGLGRAEEALKSLMEACSRGIAAFGQKRTVAKQIEGTEAVSKQFEQEMKHLLDSREAVKKAVESAATAGKEQDLKAFQGLLSCISKEQAKVRQAVAKGEQLAATMTLRHRTVKEILSEIENPSLKSLVETAANRLSETLHHMTDVLLGEAKEAEVYLLAAYEEASRQLAEHLAEYNDALTKGEAWLKQAEAQHNTLRMAAETKEEGAAAAKTAADQFQQRLEEDIAEARLKVAAGKTDWGGLDAEYSFDSRGEAAELLIQKADEARLRVAAAVGNLERHASTIGEKASQMLEALERAQEIARELEKEAKAEAMLLMDQYLQEEDESIKDQAEDAHQRANEASDLALRSSSLSKEVEKHMAEVKAAVEQMRAKLLNHRDKQPNGTTNVPAVQAANIVDDLIKYKAVALQQLSDSHEHLRKALELKTQLDGGQEGLLREVEALKGVLEADSIEELIGKLPDENPTTSLPDGEGTAPPAKPCPPYSDAKSELECLVREMEERIDRLLTVATQMREEGDAAEKAQRGALGATANLQLSRLQAKMIDQGDLDTELEGPQKDVLGEAEAVSTQLDQQLTQQAGQLEDMRSQVGGTEGIEEIMGGVLLDQAALLGLAETRLRKLIDLRLPLMEQYMKSTQHAAEVQYREREAAAAAGQSIDPNCPAAVEFASLEYRTRKLGMALQGVAGDVEVCAQRVLETLKRLKAFGQLHSLTLTTSGVRDSDALSSAARRLAADASVPSIDALIDQAKDISSRAQDVHKGLDVLISHLDALLNSGAERPPSLPESMYAAPIKKSAPNGEPVDPEGSPPTPPTGDTPTGDEEDEEKSEGSNRKLYLAVGISGGVLLLVALACSGLYSSRKRARRNSKLGQATSSSIQNQTTIGEGQGESPFLSATLDFDEIKKGKGNGVDSLCMGEEDAAKLNGEVAAVAAVPTAAVVMGDLAAGEVDTTKRQYFIDEHHLVARELGSCRPERCRTPLAYMYPSTPRDLRSPRPNITNLRPVGRWEPSNANNPQEDRPALRTQVQPEQVDEGLDHSRRAEELRDLESEVAHALQTEQQGNNTLRPPHSA